MPPSTKTATPASPLNAVVTAARAHDDVARWITAVLADPAKARAKAPDVIVPLLLAALNGGAGESDKTLSLATPLLVVASTDAEAERVADAVRWYVGEDQAAAYLSRGVPYGSGLAPAAAPAGSRQNARDVAAAGGVVVASLRALTERVPAAHVRP
ncbi:MAG: hypothetical protein H7123_09935, partial [Thermoleophilia bacterium]|nr:hypothetical protein [Thermoleophilia bacterium]